MALIAGLFAVGGMLCVVALVLVCQDVSEANALVLAQRRQILTLSLANSERTLRELVLTKRIADLKDHLRKAADVMEVSVRAHPPVTPPLPTDPYARMEELLQHPPKGAEP